MSDNPSAERRSAAKRSAGDSVDDAAAAAPGIEVPLGFAAGLDASIDLTLDAGITVRMPERVVTIQLSPSRFRSPSRRMPSVVVMTSASAPRGATKTTAPRAATTTAANRDVIASSSRVQRIRPPIGGQSYRPTV